MIIHLWHSMLDMKKYDLAWHKNDIADELKELKEGTNWLNRWSEYSDIAYTYTRAKWTGYKLKRPISVFHFTIGLIYMFPKYTLRWLFFKRAGKKFNRVIHEVRNPKKIKKLTIIAKRNGINSEQFVELCQKQLRYWPLLK